MEKETTTLNEILSHNPCCQGEGEKGGWNQLLEFLGKTEGDDEPLSYSTILESNGLDDALWCLGCHKDEGLVRTFACDCAERALYLFEDKYPDDKRPREAIETARRFIKGEATSEEMAAAGAAAWDAAGAAAGAAAWADARYAARYAAGDAAGAAERKIQSELFVEHFG